MRLTREQLGWALLAGVAALWLAFHQVGGVYADWALGLGSTQEPSGRHLLFLAYFTVFSTLGVPVLAAGLLHAFHRDRWWPGWGDRDFLLRAVPAALLLPVALHWLVLAGQPVADDESLYRYGAELLLQGRVAGESHPMRLFFDHAFLVNDGRTFSQYFLGWPAFLSVGVALGAPWLVNPVLSALTVPALYGVVRELSDRLWAQVVTGLFLLSPMLQLLAATGLSHTAALFALSWTAWLALRAAREPGRAWPAAGLAVAFSVAFFVRPLTALGIGAPFLVLWARAWWTGGRRLAPLGAFLAPAAVLGALFLLVNALQTGSPWTPAYMAWQGYARGNAFRFSGLDPATVPEVPNLAFQGLGQALRTASLGLVRLGYALLGWPVAYLFLAAALGAGGTGVLWASMGAFLLLHLPLRDTGIDTVGPVHFTELALPVLALTGVGMARAAAWLQGRLGTAGADGADGDSSGDGADPFAHLLGRRLVLATAAALLLGNLVLYAPARLRAVSVVGALVSVPSTALERAGVEDAVVFSSVPWALACNPAFPVPSRPFVFWWPVNEPGLGDDVLHANHLSVEADRALMAEHFPDRTGWLMHWRENCSLALVRLDDPAAEEIPDGILLSGQRGTLRWDPSHAPTGEVPPGFAP